MNFESFSRLQCFLLSVMIKNISPGKPCGLVWLLPCFQTVLKASISGSSHAISHVNLHRQALFRFLIAPHSMDVHTKESYKLNMMWLNWWNFPGSIGHVTKISAPSSLFYDSATTFIVCNLRSTRNLTQMLFEILYILWSLLCRIYQHQHKNSMLYVECEKNLICHPNCTLYM